MASFSFLLPLLLLLPHTPATSPIPAPASIPDPTEPRIRKWSLRSRWHEGIVLLLYCSVLAKCTTNSSRSLASIELSKFGFLGKNLWFCLWSIHFKLKSKHLAALLADNFSKPVSKRDYSYVS